MARLTPGRCSVVGAALGFLSGLGEALRLSTIPYPEVLLHPSVNLTIWLIAPLAGAFCLGILGLGVGLAGYVCRRRPGWLPSYAAALGMGLASVYAGTALGFLHGYGRGPIGALTQVQFWIWFASGFLLIWLPSRPLYSYTAPRLIPRVDQGVAWTACLLAFCFLACLAGLGLYRTRQGLYGAQTPAGSRSTSSRPNIVLITLDTVRADHLSSYGYARPTTPRLDALARRGVVFENAIAPAPWTLTSHATILTELLPHQHGANWAVPLHPGPKTLAQVLQSHGYSTAGFSSNYKYGLGGWGMDQGFDIYGGDGASLRHQLRATVFGRHVAQRFYEKLVRTDDFARLDARQLNREALAWLSRPHDRPFFLFINYFDAHGPYWAPPPFDSRFGTLPPGLAREMPRLSGVLQPAASLDRNKEALVAAYDNCLAFLDEQVGEFIARLDELPAGANTYVIITSDHGEEFGEHGSYSHGWDLYRDVLHVPLIIVGPEVPAGLRIAQLARVRDLFVTALDFALPGSEFSRQHSLRRFWTPGWRPQLADELAISELDSTLGHSKSAAISLMTPEWHYIHTADGQTELYHWPTDSREQSNLARSPAQESVLQDLRMKLEWMVGLSHTPWRGPEYLRALDPPGDSFLRQTIFRLQPWPSDALGLPRVGSAQMRIAGSSSTQLPLRHPIDEELLRSLPYH
jgi:arylsulfatase A-like enzyme